MRSLSSRLTLWYALMATLTTCVFIVGGRYLIEESYISGIDMLNDKEFEEIQPRIERHFAEGESAAALKAIEEHSEIDASLFFFQVNDARERALLISSNLAGRTLPSSVHRQRRITVADAEFGSLRVGWYTTAGYDIYIASSLQGLDSLLQNISRLGAIGAIAVFLVSIAVGRLLSKAALRPIEKIENTAAKISAHNLSERIPVLDTGDEVSKLANLLNTMFDRLEMSFDEVRRFTADASHELKTPLSLIRLNAEKLQATLGSADPQTSKLVDNQLELVDSLNKVVNDLLILAKADGGALKLSLSRLRTGDFIGDFAADAQALCEDGGLRFELANRYDGMASFDPTWLRHLLFNLISNAIRFSPPGAAIKLASSADAGDWVIEITDEGPGIDPRKARHLFERFYNEEDPQGGKGSGLGLPLCRSIARLHHGSVDLQNRADRSGAIATARFPLGEND